MKSSFLIREIILDGIIRLVFLRGGEGGVFSGFLILTQKCRLIPNIKSTLFQFH